jgi:CheY-like chemotaxis protein
LVVDDQEPFRRAATAVVEATDGFVLAGAVGSGEESIEAVTRLRPDLVLMDVNLPGIDGMDAARQLGALPDAPVVVLLSTYDEAEFAGRAEASGAVAYLHKSGFGPDRLAGVWARARGEVTG